MVYGSDGCRAGPGRRLTGSRRSRVSLLESKVRGVNSGAVGATIHTAVVHVHVISVRLTGHIDGLAGRRHLVTAGFAHPSRCSLGCFDTVVMIRVVSLATVVVAPVGPVHSQACCATATKSWVPAKGYQSDTRPLTALSGTSRPSHSDPAALCYISTRPESDWSSGGAVHAVRTPAYLLCPVTRSLDVQTVYRAPSRRLSCFRFLASAFSAWSLRGLCHRRRQSGVWDESTKLWRVLLSHIRVQRTTIKRAPWLLY